MKFASQVKFSYAERNLLREYEQWTSYEFKIYLWVKKISYLSVRDIIPTNNDEEIIWTSYISLLKKKCRELICCITFYGTILLSKK